MKWGMSSWDKNTASKKWLKAVSDKYSSKLEKTENPKGKKSKLPVIKTGKVLGYDILEERAKTILNKLDFKINVDKLMENPSDYYILNYWPDYNYEKGHLPGAIQYDPKLSLTVNKDLLTLPTDKKIVVYCYTGQNASYTAAYLQILGYDAYTLTYGANSFMHSKLKSLKIGHAFDNSQIKNYPLVEGELPSIKKEGQADEEPEEDNATPIIIKKKASKEEEGGC
jgi:rhodanese-related sulfurtransferase